MLSEYNRSDFKPIFVVENNYEFENTYTDGGSTQICHDTKTGQYLAANGTKSMDAASKKSARESGYAERDDLDYMSNLCGARKWFDLILKPGLTGS